MGTAALSLGAQREFCAQNSARAEFCTSRTRGRTQLSCAVFDLRLRRRDLNSSSFCARDLKTKHFLLAAPICFPPPAINLCTTAGRLLLFAADRPLPPRDRRLPRSRSTTPSPPWSSAPSSTFSTSSTSPDSSTCLPVLLPCSAGPSARHPTASFRSATSSLDATTATQRPTSRPRPRAPANSSPHLLPAAPRDDQSTV